MLIDPFQWIQLGMKDPYSWPNVALIPCKYSRFTVKPDQYEAMYVQHLFRDSQCDYSTPNADEIIIGLMDASTCQNDLWQVGNYYLLLFLISPAWVYSHLCWLSMDNR